MVTCYSQLICYANFVFYLKYNLKNYLRINYVIPNCASERRHKAKTMFSRCRFSRVEQDRFGICPTTPTARNIGQMLKRSWIYSALAELHLRSFAPTGSICSLSEFHFVHPYANPQVQHDITAIISIINNMTI